MARAAFAWETHVRREVLDDEMARLRELPHSIWDDVLRTPMTRHTTGRDGRVYRLKVTAARAARESRDIRVTVTLQTARLHRSLMQTSFVITPDNQFRD